jgi:hypothetical protein
MARTWRNDFWELSRFRMFRRFQPLLPWYLTKFSRQKSRARLFCGRDFSSFRKRTMNRINIDHLSEAELIDLNHRIVQRLRLMSQVRAHKAMLEFRIGDHVTFEPHNGTPVFGVLTRYNKKSVTVITGDGQHWNVSPRLLRLAEAAHPTQTQQSAHPSSVIPFKQK